MENYFYIVTVSCETRQQADLVMENRIEFNADYGFEYQVDHEFNSKDSTLWDEIKAGNCSGCGKEMLWDRGERMYYCLDEWIHN